VATVDDATRAALLRRGFALEYVTLAWNVVGIIVLAIAAVLARSVALAGFGLDSLIEIGASTVVIWELSGTGADRQRRGLRLIGYAFAALAAYLLVQCTVVLVTGYHPRHSVLGIAWTSVTAVAMFALAFGKARTGKALGNPVLQTEGRVTLIDGILATAVLAALALNAALGWWWADPAAGYVLVFYAAREILLRPSDLDRSRRFYRDMLGLAIYREFGPPDDPGVVFFPGRDEVVPSSVELRWRSR
jgi:divalent metal cation (Fe/Co/Zn/Cd) transporter